MAWIKKGDNFLQNVSKEELKKLYHNEKKAKAKLRLLAAIQRKEGKTLEDISSYLQKPKTTIHDWLQRIGDKGLKNLYDVKQPGKPPRLNKNQLKELEAILDEPPLKQGMPFVLWITNLVQYIILKKFNKKFEVRQIRNIVKKINFTLQIPRQEHRKANNKLQEEFKKKLKQKFNITLNLDSRSSALMKRSSE